jgi:hypothetical protein
MKKPSFSGYACFSQKLKVALFTGTDLNNMVVLESNPDQGYFFGGSLPEEMKNANDHHLYLVVRKTIPCFQDRIIRHAHYIKNVLKLNFHISPGQMTFENETHSCIRVRINELGLLKDFIDDLEEMGIEFYYGRRYRHLQPYESLVQFKKYVDFEKIFDGVYRDMEDMKTHYVEIPSDIDFNLFETMTEDIKNNCELNMFNTALVYFHLKDKVMDMIALYSRECNEERLPVLAEFLDKEIKRLIK